MDIIDKKKEKNMRGRAGDRTLGHLHSRRTPKAGILPLDHEGAAHVLVGPFAILHCNDGDAQYKQSMQSREKQLSVRLE